MTGPVGTSERNVFGRLYHGETRYDFVGRWKRWFAISGAILVIGVVVLITRGLNLGIDFTGGTVWQVPAGEAQVAEVQDAMGDLGYGNVQVQEVTQAGGEGRVIRVVAEDTAEPASETTDALEQVTGDLAAARGALPEDQRGEIGPVQENLLAIEGPFADPVPAPLAQLQQEVDGLEALVSDAADPRPAVAEASAEMRALVDDLSVLQQEERSRLGQGVSSRLAELSGSGVEEVVVDTVGPSWGEQITNSARNALVVFMIAITIFITIRFELKMALATAVALFHDLLLVVGLYALSGLAVTPATVVALLTMLGFSIYDGIVVFDRVNENTETLLTGRAKHTYSEMANISLNQVLMRSLNTSITTLLPIGSVLIIGSVLLGATTLQEFGVALFLGLAAGAYSSIFIATPLLALLKEREPRYRNLRQQIAERGHATMPEKTAVVDDDPVLSSVQAASPTPTTRQSQAPRPRKRGRKR
ncbi:hypothetical protein BH23ACT2_BH23ACT2_04040 [soil metagenome]